MLVIILAILRVIILATPLASSMFKYAGYSPCNNAGNSAGKFCVQFRRNIIDACRPPAITLAILRAIMLVILCAILPAILRVTLMTIALENSAYDYAGYSACNNAGKFCTQLRVRSNELMKESPGKRKPEVGMRGCARARSWECKDTLARE